MHTANYKDARLALTICHYVILSLGMAINGALILVFMKSRRVRSIPGNKLILSLLLSDFLIEIGFAATATLQHAPELTKIIVYSVHVLAMTLTVLNLCMIWIDRVIEIKLSFRYSRLMNNTAISTMLCVAWITGIAFACLSIGIFFIQRSTAYTKSMYVISTITIAGFLVLGIANLIIFREVRAQIIKIKLQQMRHCKGILMLHFRSAYMCALMVTAFLIFWLPHVVENVRVLLNVEWNHTWFSSFADLMISSNTLVNPCLYIALKKDLRKLLKRRWKKSWRKLSNRDVLLNTSSIAIIRLRNLSTQNSSLHYCTEGRLEEAGQEKMAEIVEETTKQSCILNNNRLASSIAIIRLQNLSTQNSLL